MAYSTDNPPALLVNSINGGKKVWMYVDEDFTTDIDVSGYITNGYDLGMRKGDILFGVSTAANPVGARVFLVVEATPATVDLSVGTTINNADTE